MLERVVVPLDGSAASRAVLEQSLPLLRNAGELILLRVIDPAGPDVPGAEARVEAEARVLSGLGVGTRATTVVGEPAAAILETAESFRATLVAMTTHGSSGPSRWTMGSVATKVLRACHAPVLIVRSFVASDENPDTGFPTHVLVPIDGSELALEAVPVLRQLARLTAPEISVVHFASELGGERALREGTHHLAHARGLLHALGLRARTQLLRGDPASGILAHGGAPGSGGAVDLILMTSHGRSGLTRWMLGSVTEKVLRHASVPMLVVKRHPTASVTPLEVMRTALA